MKKLITCIFVLSAFIVLSSCDSDSDPTAIQKIAAIKTEPTAVEKIINNNSFIDIDLSQISKQITMGTIAAKAEDLAKTKADIYRFYSHVHLNENKQYVCLINSAQEINVSQNVFDTLKKNLDETNSIIEQTIDSGNNIIVPEITTEYLNSLLKQPILEKMQLQ